MKIEAEQAYYIKLGQAGDWEAECLREGTLRLGYLQSRHDLCVQQNWPSVLEQWKEYRTDPGSATRDVKQIRVFYESNEATLFITFVGGLLYWCRPCGPVELLKDGSRRRATYDGWHKTSSSGVPLTDDKLSGHLLQVRGFRGAICKVKAFDYLLRKINDELLPAVAEAEEAERVLLSANIALMRLLRWQDFELLVDLVFSTTGWRRIGVLGRTQKTVDLEILLPSTGERAFVQVKSQTTPADFQDYVRRFAASDIYQRMFFVWHTGDILQDDSLDNITPIGPQKLSRMILEAGLSSWLREKVS